MKNILLLCGFLILNSQLAKAQDQSVIATCEDYTVTYYYSFEGEIGGLKYVIPSIGVTQGNLMIPVEISIDEMPPHRPMLTTEFDAATINPSLAGSIRYVYLEYGSSQKTKLFRVFKNDELVKKIVCK